MRWNQFVRRQFWQREPGSPAGLHQFVHRTARKVRGSRRDCFQPPVSGPVGSVVPGPASTYRTARETGEPQHCHSFSRGFGDMLREGRAKARSYSVTIQVRQRVPSLPAQQPDIRREIVAALFRVRILQARNLWRQ